MMANFFLLETCVAIFRALVNVAFLCTLRSIATAIAKNYAVAVFLKSEDG